MVSTTFYFQPYLGKWSNLTNIFQMGWNHQLVNMLVSGFFLATRLFLEWRINLFLLLGCRFHLLRRLQAFRVSGGLLKIPKISEKTTQAQVMTFFLRKIEVWRVFVLFLFEADFSYINKCWSFRYAFDFFCSVAVYANMGQGRNNSEWISSGGCTKREANKGGFG